MILSNKNMVLFDSEATSLSLGTALPWQFAWIVKKNGKVVEKKEYYPKIEDLNVSAGAARVTKFSMAHYNSVAVDADFVADEIERVFFSDPSLTIAGHNILGYDVYILKNFFDYVGRPLKFEDFINRSLDSLALARGRHYESQPPLDNHSEFMAWQYRMLHRFERGIKTSLGALADQFNIDYDKTKTHDALYDIELNDKVLQHLVYALEAC